MHTGINKDRGYETHSESNISSRETGILDKQSKKCTNSVATTGVLRVCVQYENYEDICSNQKIDKINDKNKANHEQSTKPTQLQVVRQFDGENDFNDTSDWGSLTTYSTHAEGSSNKFTLS